MLLSIPGVELLSLQKGNVREADTQKLSDMKIRDLSNELNDFSDTASIIENLDLVITVDTSVAHLAGAMGKPVWTLLPYIPDWRWMLDGDDTPWYPTMKLYRQKKHGDWEDVFNRVASDLINNINKRDKNV
jgi:ADP-heptose:LPS heptosyltransferase